MTVTNFRLGFAISCLAGFYVSCGSDTLPTPDVVPPIPPVVITSVPGSTLFIDSITDESNDGIIVSGELVSIHGDTTANFNLATSITLDGTEILPIANVSPNTITFTMPAGQSLSAYLPIVVSNATEWSAATIEHRKLVLVPSPLENRVRVLTLKADGSLEDSKLRLITDLTPGDIEISRDGQFAFISSTVGTHVYAHRLPQLHLANIALTNVTTPANYIIDLGIAQAGLDLSSDSRKLLVSIDDVAVSGRKEIAFVAVNPNPSAFSLTHIDIDASVSSPGTQNVILTGGGDGARDLQIASNGTFALAADRGTNTLQLLSLSGLFNGLPTDIDLNFDLSLPGIFDVSDVQIFRNDTRAVITGRNQTNFAAVDITSKSTFTHSIDFGFGASSNDSRIYMKPTSSGPSARLLIPTTNDGVQIYDVSNNDPALWSHVFEPILGGFAHGGLESFDISSDGRYGIWLCNQSPAHIHVIQMNKVENGVGGDEVVGGIPALFSLSGTDATVAKIQP